MKSYEEIYNLSAKNTAEATKGQRRTLHVIDIENLCGGVLSVDNIRDTLSRYVSKVPLAKHDLFVIACDESHIRKLSTAVDEKWQALLLPAQGQDGADKALVHWLTDYFQNGGRPGSLFIASGDHYFERVALLSSMKGAAIRFVFRNQLSASNSLRSLRFPNFHLFSSTEIDPLSNATDDGFVLVLLVNEKKRVSFYVGPPPKPEHWDGYTAFTTTKLGRKLQKMSVGDEFYEGQTSYELLEKSILEHE